MKEKDVANALHIFNASIETHISAISSLRIEDLYDMAFEIYCALAVGFKIMLCGNGGSAADAEHIAAEFVGRFKKDRRPFPAMALTANSNILTALSNDYGYQEVFTRQVRAYGKKGDILLLFSTSGESENVVSAATVAQNRGIKTFSFTGVKTNTLDVVSDRKIKVNSDNTARIQEIHILAAHIICELVDAFLLEGLSQHDL